MNFELRFIWSWDYSGQPTARQFHRNLLMSNEDCIPFTRSFLSKRRNYPAVADAISFHLLTPSQGTVPSDATVNMPLDEPKHTGMSWQAGTNNRATCTTACYRVSLSGSSLRRHAVEHHKLSRFDSDTATCIKHASSDMRCLRQYCYIHLLEVH